MKTLSASIEANYRAVMDHRHNPLRHLDLASQHYFMQVLGWMWSMIFSLSFLSILSFGYVWMGHLLVFGGIAMTVAVFREADKQKPAVITVKTNARRDTRCVWQLDREA
ncbi:MAG: hypothetical protein U5K56_13910 [Halioglobus sp.]|nr:hypothetical protein [Halioglobus sp.]